MFSITRPSDSFGTSIHKQKQDMCLQKQTLTGGGQKFILVKNIFVCSRTTTQGEVIENRLNKQKN